MKELNMAVYTGKDGENKVTLTAAFATHAEAVDFHRSIAHVCHSYTQAAKPSVWAQRALIFRPKSKDDGVGG